MLNWQLSARENVIVEDFWQRCYPQMIVSNLRHSPLGWIARKLIHLLFAATHSPGKPVQYRLPGPVDISMYPDGEVAEFLWLPGVFESFELQMVAKLLKPGMRVVDVGANIGLYSLLAGALVSEAGRVWAFEPSKESYRRLIANLKLNGCPCVQPIEIALTSKPDQSMQLVSDPGYGDAYRYLANTVEEKGNDRAETIRATTLDACAKEQGINDVDLVKIDVEGQEYAVLLGAREFLGDNKNVVVMFESEADWCARAGCKQEDAFVLLRELGFRLFAWDKARASWSEDERKLLNSGTIWAARKDLPGLN